MNSILFKVQVCFSVEHEILFSKASWNHFPDFFFNYFEKIQLCFLKLKKIYILLHCYYRVVSCIDSLILNWTPAKNLLCVQSETKARPSRNTWESETKPLQSGLETKTTSSITTIVRRVSVMIISFSSDGRLMCLSTSAGVGRTGVFITLSIVLERMRYEGVVDLFQTVKTLRTQRPSMVQTEVRHTLNISPDSVSHMAVVEHAQMDRVFS